MNRFFKWLRQRFFSVKKQLMLTEGIAMENPVRHGRERTFSTEADDVKTEESPVEATHLNREDEILQKLGNFMKNWQTVSGAPMTVSFRETSTYGDKQTITEITLKIGVN